MATQVYDRMFFYLGGDLTVEAEGINMAYQGDPLPVATLVKQFAGVTPVPKSVKIDITEFIPITGGNVTEVIKAFLNTTKVKGRVQFGGSGAIGNYEGFIMAPTLSSSASDHSKLGYSFVGTATEMS